MIKLIEEHEGGRDKIDAAIDAVFASRIEVYPRRGDLFVIAGAFWIYAHYDLIKYLRHNGVVFGLFVHDLIQIKNPQYVHKEATLVFRRSLIDALSIANFVLTNSHFVADEVKAFLAERPDFDLPVAAVPLATELRLKAKGVDARLPNDVADILARDYVLCVGTIEVRKNHLLLIKIWERLANELGDALPDLVFVGKWGWDIAPLRKYLDETDFLDGRVHVVTNASDAALVELYRHCLMTTYVSFAEGFGLPVGESLAYGKPCVASRATSLPEVGGDFAKYIDPNDPDEGVKLFKALLTNRGEIDRWSADIKANYAPKTWRKFTYEFLDICCVMAKQGGAGAGPTIVCCRPAPSIIWGMTRCAASTTNGVRCPLFAWRATKVGIRLKIGDAGPHRRRRRYRSGRTWRRSPQSSFRYGSKRPPADGLRRSRSELTTANLSAFGYIAWPPGASWRAKSRTMGLFTSNCNVMASLAGPTPAISMSACMRSRSKATVLTPDPPCCDGRLFRGAARRCATPPPELTPRALLTRHNRPDELFRQAIDDRFAALENRLSRDAANPRLPFVRPGGEVNVPLSLALPAPGVLTAPAGLYMTSANCLGRDFYAAEYADFCKSIGKPIELHRRTWEYAFVAQHLEQRGVLVAGSRGLAIGAADDPLPRLFGARGCQIALSSEDGLVDRRFDFLWSISATMNGSETSVRRSVLDLIERQLKRGGVAVFTGDFNISSYEPMSSTQTSRACSRADVEQLVQFLEERGHSAAHLPFELGLTTLDMLVDMPPFASGAHLKIMQNGSVVTCCGLVVVRG